MQEQGWGSKSGFRSFSLARETSVQPFTLRSSPEGSQPPLPTSVQSPFPH